VGGCPCDGSDPLGHPRHWPRGVSGTLSLTVAVTVGVALCGDILGVALCGTLSLTLTVSDCGALCDTLLLTIAGPLCGTLSVIVADIFGVDLAIFLVWYDTFFGGGAEYDA
jgi:hypothetical protein